MKTKNLKIITLFCLIVGLGKFGFAQDATVTIDQDEDIAKLLDYKKDVKTAEVYKIQLDFGSRSEAMKLRENFRNTFSQWPSELVYETPNYKVWVGNFSTRLEADIALLEIKKKFTKAMVFIPKKDDKN
ncbi:SPOR domain-containing protein [Psychroserpens sp.]|uniref:SPOR domain-containing protein n=1 Tax=Psychroserpens sp. TaxID=2020870 RepID=UPI001B234913|nr:SPOR domain-containing protein [Psychroserpens sp.]MBO6607818.1 SPOR domain-containing protein [Psychroserpens sp.]MBO6654809.1 SPOR domain-containing protein [Psychroserpens sp.]MBO6682767.1 SPOR domain-containing protein [Psychroserpens sp.]MBO6751176.1 SPOR domain-containing protein [Psychroserpens sp.]MBO6916255.1 SPOR domain-containing protein [Psychroserpens sp.]